MNFLELHRLLAWMFLLLSGIALIRMTIYRFMGGLDYLDHINPLARFSFGNFGFSTANCGMNLVDWNLEETKLHFQCQGTTRISEIRSAGILTPRENKLRKDVNENFMTNCYLP